MPRSFSNMPARLPEIMVSLTAGPIWPFSIRKLFLATPEKSPLLEGLPPEKRLTSRPRSMPAMISAMDLLPAGTIRLKLELGAALWPVLLAT